MRTGQLADASGYSVQQVRKLERAGVIPPARRATNGYREYVEVHLTCLVGYRLAAQAIGPVEAKNVLVDLHTDPSSFLERIDQASAALHRERRELSLARRAVRDIAEEPLLDPRPTDAMSVGELAGALGVRTSTLRHWEAERLLTPERDASGARTYRPVDVRDARLVQQLRHAGHRIGPLRALLPVLRESNTWDSLLDERERSIADRSLALLRAGAVLVDVLDAHQTP